MGRGAVQVVVTSDILALDKMMMYLNVKDLLSCRLVSHLWNRAASLELRERSTMMKTIRAEDQLMELEGRMERSWNFPFAGLHLKTPGKLKSGAARDFFQNYGARFTRLGLGTTHGMEKMDDLNPIINHLCNLSVLELGDPPDGPFDKLSRSTAGQSDDVLTRLAKVQTMRISGTFPGHCEQVLGQILEAASPSLQIEFLDGTPGMLRVVKIAGRLQAVRVIKFDAVDLNLRKCYYEIDELLSTSSPSLTKLDFHSDGHLSKYGLKKVLFSSQRTLRELRLVGTCLSELSLYKHLAFTELTKLSFDRHVWYDRDYLIRGRNPGNFPALKHLKLKISYVADLYERAVFLDDLVIPSVTTFDLDGYVNEDGMTKLAQMFPNVIEIRLDYGYYSGQFINCGENPSEIWNVREFKCLKKLVIWNFVVGRSADCTTVCRTDTWPSNN